MSYPPGCSWGAYDDALDGDALAAHERELASAEAAGVPLVRCACQDHETARRCSTCCDTGWRLPMARALAEIAGAALSRAAARTTGSVECPRCHGTGEGVPAWEDCGACDGLGRVHPDVVAEMRGAA